MLIGDIARGTRLKIRHENGDNAVIYKTIALEKGNNNFELIVKTINTENNKLAVFDDFTSLKLEIEGENGLILPIDEIHFNYNNGRAYHTLVSRSRIEISNKRNSIRMPFFIDCDVKAHNKRFKGKIRDISFEGIGLVMLSTDMEGITTGSKIIVDFYWGLNQLSFDLNCKVVRVQQLNDRFVLLGCSIEVGQNSIKSLIMHLQLEEVRKRRSTYTYKK